MNLTPILRQLRQARSEAQAKVDQLDTAIETISNLGASTRPRRKMSAAARRKIAQAQRRRWAAFRAGKK